ncbi:MAG: aspartate kinase [Candidatus Aenigmarchaeota archaeon]|nr:aspartate kinase [Candidatus Aenigmarchaeota archaeon]
MSGLVVVKFGGSVLTGADSFRAAAGYAAARNAVSLVSGMNGLTNAFMDMYDQQVYGIEWLTDVYRRVVSKLPHELKQAVLKEIAEELNPLPVYQKIGARDAFVGSPEGHAAILLKYHLKAQGVVAAHLTGPDAGFFFDRHGLVDMDTSREFLANNVGAIVKCGQMAVVGGYLGIGGDHYYRVGARNINDACATALAGALGAGEVHIIKDVPGVYRVPPEFGDYGLLGRLSYNEARKMSSRGSPIVHPTGVRMAQDGGIPVIVKSMDSRGTTIAGETQTTPENPVAALVPERTCMVTVRDDIMDTPEGMEYPVLIHQFENKNGADMGIAASDVGGFSYTVTLGDRKKANGNGALVRAHTEELRDYLNAHGYRPVVEGEEIGMITVVGDSMQRRPGTLSYVSGVLGRKGISVLSAVQSNERHAPPSITMAVDADKLEATTRALAEELFA